MFLKASPCAHVISVDLMLPLAAPTLTDVFISNVDFVQICKLSPTPLPPNLQTLKFHSAFPSLLTGKLNEAIENKAFRLNLAERGRNLLSTSKWKDSDSLKKLTLSTDFCREYISLLFQLLQLPE